MGHLIKKITPELTPFLTLDLTPELTPSTSSSLWAPLPSLFGSLHRYLTPVTTNGAFYPVMVPFWSMLPPPGAGVQGGLREKHYPRCLFLKSVTLLKTAAHHDTNFNRSIKIADDNDTNCQLLKYDSN